MHAKAPLDIDLEDKLLYGMTPIRLAYLAVALLAGFALWSSPWAPSPVRMFTCLVVVAIGAGLAWGKWRGRPADAWVADISMFAVSNHRFRLDGRWLKRPTHRQVQTQPVTAVTASGGLADPVRVVVVARTPEDGASNIAAELQACFAAKNEVPGRWSVSAAQAGQTPSPALLSVTVAAVYAGRACYLDRGDGPVVAGIIPEDSAVRAAAALGLATVHAFPDAPASRAFRDLADLIAVGAS